MNFSFQNEKIITEIVFLIAEKIYFVNEFLFRDEKLKNYW